MVTRKPFPSQNDNQKSDFRPAPKNTFLYNSKKRWKTPNSIEMDQRRRRLKILKWLLPIFSVVLLALIALWPSFSYMMRNRNGMLSDMPHDQIQSGILTQPIYKTIDGQKRLVTVTAKSSSQKTDSVIFLNSPIADILDKTGDWEQLSSKSGEYDQKAHQLYLYEEVFLYRNDGLTIMTSASVVDIAQHIIRSYDWVHAESPFGVLDAKGFFMDNRSQIIQFDGPVKLVLSGWHTDNPVVSNKDEKLDQ